MRMINKTRTLTLLLITAGVAIIYFTFFVDEDKESTPASSAGELLPVAEERSEPSTPQSQTVRGSQAENPTQTKGRESISLVTSPTPPKSSAGIKLQDLPPQEVERLRRYDYDRYLELLADSEGPDEYEGLSREEIERKIADELVRIMEEDGEVLGDDLAEESDLTRQGVD